MELNVRFVHHLANIVVVPKPLAITALIYIIKMEMFAEVIIKL